MLKPYSFFYIDTTFSEEKFEKIIAAKSEKEARAEFNKFLNFLASAGRIVHETTK